MFCRTTVAAIYLLGFVADNRASAQPVVPGRPRTNAFQNLFGPAGGAIPNAGLMPLGPNNLLGPGFNGQFPNAFAYAYGPGVGSQDFGGGHPVMFNNTGHWYSNYYGHWYPNGIASGAGVSENSSGGGFGGGSGFRTGGLGYGGMGTGGLGAPIGIGAMPGGIRH